MQSIANVKKNKKYFFCFQVISSVFPNYLFRIVNENNEHLLVQNLF